MQKPPIVAQSHPEIILIRHGRPALSRNILLTSAGYQDWWADYDRVGLWEGQSVPPYILAFVEGAHIVASSPLPRALHSARLARDGAEPDMILPDMIEAPLPPPALGPLKFRPLSWGTISRILWMGGRAAGGESARQARQRARGQAAELSTLAETGRVVVFAHGWFNRMVGRELRRAGWRSVEGRGDGYWSYRRFVPAN